MERSINPDFLRIALGEHEKLPSSMELSSLLAEAEISLLMHDFSVPEKLLATGWYLHGIASSKQALEIYGIERNRAAFQVAGHIFDLKLHDQELSEIDRLNYCFASQIAYSRSSLDPNALALYRREIRDKTKVPNLIKNSQLISLYCGVAFLGLSVNHVYALSNYTEKMANFYVKEWDVKNIQSTIFGGVTDLVAGIKDLMNFLLYGNVKFLKRGREELFNSINSITSRDDLTTRWVASHLFNYSVDIENSTVWNVLPPNIPSSIRKAFINGDPRILTLWPPQIDFLGTQGENNPLTGDVRRLLISTPTSGGKTVSAQLLITSHLSENISSVCYVAPTRSLCHEVRRSLESRLRFIRRGIVDGLPEGEWFENLINDFQHNVEVMTPERLSYLIRSDSEGLLQRFGMFIFDEVHLLNDKGRGWTLEESLSYLHYKTKNTGHKIVLISAALGNRNHIIQWLGEGESDQRILDFHKDWKGPRKITAIWTTLPKWEEAKSYINERARKFPFIKETPLYGQLNIRVSESGEIKTLLTKTPIGKIILKAESENGEYKRDSKSSNSIQMLVPTIQYLEKFGPVLIIESTKPRTLNFAKKLAELYEPIKSKEISELIELVIFHLGEHHPLKQCLEKGVAYHHGALPMVIRIAIEDAVRKGDLRLIVATTTLTEGINLPVTSVVISSQGSFYSDGVFHKYITGAKLVNAIGRAGRAAKETEGIVLLAKQSSLVRSDFDELYPNDEDLYVKSMLSTNEALEALTEFERAYRGFEDSIFEANNEYIVNFIKYVWFISSETEKIYQFVDIKILEEILKNTLGWVQLDQENQIRWINFAKIILEKYLNIDISLRQRWASSNTSINSSRKLEEISNSIIDELELFETPQDIFRVVELLILNNRLDQIRDLAETPKRKVYTLRGNSRTVIDISEEELLIDWIKGISLLELSEKYFYEVRDIDFRFEQLSEYLNNNFEKFLPWIFGTLINWVNRRLIENSRIDLLPTSIPGIVHYGVGSVDALRIMIRGIHSRNLATRIANEWYKTNQEQEIISWVKSLSIAQWIELFQATPSEIRNLLEFSREQVDSFIIDLFNKELASLEINSYEKDYALIMVQLEKVGEGEFAEIGIWDGSKLIGTVFSKDRSDVEQIINSGLSVHFKFSASSDIGILIIELVEPT